MDNRKRYFWSLVVAIAIAAGSQAQESILKSIGGQGLTIPVYIQPYRDTCYCRVILLPEVGDPRTGGMLWLSPVVRRIRTAADDLMNWRSMFYEPLWVDDDLLGFRIDWQLIPLNRIYDPRFCDQSRLEKGPYY